MFLREKHSSEKDNPNNDDFKDLAPTIQKQIGFSQSLQTLPSLTFSSPQNIFKEQIRHTYGHFPPYREYYLKGRKKFLNCFNNDELLLAYGGLPNRRYSPIINAFDKPRLSQQRMGMYYRGAVNQYVPEEILEQEIGGQNGFNHRGPINRHGNKGLIVEGHLYYVVFNAIYRVRVPDQIVVKNIANHPNRNMNQMRQENIIKSKPSENQTYSDTGCGINDTFPTCVVKFDNQYQILQLLRLKDYNNLVQEQCILVRFSRHYKIYSIESNTVIYDEWKSINSQDGLQGGSSAVGQCITAKYNPYTQEIQSLRYVDLNKKQTAICSTNIGDSYHHINTHSNRSSQINPSPLKSLQQLDGFYHTLMIKDRSTNIIASYNGLLNVDKRASEKSNMSNILYRTLNGECLWGCVQIKGRYTYSPYIGCVERSDLKIFDLRMTGGNKMMNGQQRKCGVVEKYPHMHQECPPSIIQFYDGQEDKLNVPVLGCFSPYSMGSAMMLPFNTQEKVHRTKYQWEEDNTTLTPKLGFKLLYDSSKLNQNGRISENGNINSLNFLHRKRPKFVSQSERNIDIDDYSSSYLLEVYTTDTSGRISMEIFQKQQRDGNSYRFKHTNNFVEQYQTVHIQDSQQEENEKNKNELQEDQSLRWFHQNQLSKYGKFVVVDNAKTKSNSKNKRYKNKSGKSKEKQSHRVLNLQKKNNLLQDNILAAKEASMQIQNDQNKSVNKSKNTKKNKGKSKSDQEFLTNEQYFQKELEKPTIEYRKLNYCNLTNFMKQLERNSEEQFQQEQESEQSHKNNEIESFQQKSRIEEQKMGTLNSQIMGSTFQSSFEGIGSFQNDATRTESINEDRQMVERIYSQSKNGEKIEYLTMDCLSKLQERWKIEIEDED